MWEFYDILEEKKREKQENLEDKNRNRNIYEPLC
jgi:hypothetical protein